MRRSTIRLACLLTAAICAASPRAETLEPATPTPRGFGFGESELAAYSWAGGGTLTALGAGFIIVGFSAGGNEAVGMAGLGLMGAALTAGPAMGQWYAGATPQGWWSTGARALGLAMIAVGPALPIEDMSCVDAGGSDCMNKGMETLSTALILSGAMTYVGSTIYSLVDTHRAVQRNRRAQSHIDLAPTLALDSEGRLAPGAMASLRF